MIRGTPAVPSASARGLDASLFRIAPRPHGIRHSPHREAGANPAVAVDLQPESTRAALGRGGWIIIVTAAVFAQAFWQIDRPMFCPCCKCRTVMPRPVSALEATGSPDAMTPRKKCRSSPEDSAGQ